MTLANILVFKSLILISQGKLATRVFENLTEALKIYNKTFHGEKKHRNQARAHFVMGKAYVAQENYKKGLDGYLLSEDIYNTVLKEKKIDDVSELYTELAMLGIQTKDEEIIHKYLKAHIDTFGRKHPRTMEILLTLDKNNLPVPF